MAGGRRSGWVALVLTSTCAMAGAARAEDGFGFGQDGLTLSLANGAAEFELGGRLHLDGMLFEDEEEFVDNADVRRARLELAGQLGDKVRVRVDYEFTDDGDWNNVWASYQVADTVDVRLGQFIPAFSMEDLQSSNNIMFLERALPQAFAPGYTVGGELGAYGRNWTATFGAFNDPIDSDVDARGTNGDSLVGRFTYDPDLAANQILHFGVGLEWRFLDAGSGFRIDSKPEAFQSPVRFVNTGNLRGVNEFVNVSLEAAWRRGNLMAQGQYVRMMLDRENRPDPDFDGWYVEGSWIPTGEERRYSKSAGLFGPVTPKTSKGAWEIRARYSMIDLTDKTVSGGVERDASVGVTWWRTSKIRFMFEYINAVADPDFNDDDQIADILQARIQFAI
ncbi:OprO/OprP family phosphate-selective porin [Caulobacter sp. 17J80-11]|uniref:OprO/OprP family phosphate-selective porin n=1 Tax=Caulobacter sp. 17J80-11 TaxID=2763502 RepID=UPI0016537F1C|nr:porin [Caulobacter sp. 17J80-11]MBC6981631.1 hypothetical protein [Caulobacter sp. 17J80-11]